MDKYHYITDNFQYYEFFSGDSKLGRRSIEPPPKLRPNVIEMANQLQKVRDHIGMAIIINSAYRTEAWNKLNGGAVKSFHLTAEAVDLKCRRLTPGDLAIYVSKLTNLRGFGVKGKSFVHCDLRPRLHVFKY